jgi:hypothetical protein
MTGAGRRGKHPRRALLIAAVVVIVVAAVAGILLALRGHGPGSKLASQSNPAAGGGTTARDARTPAAAAAGAPDNGPLPAGWSWYTAPASSMGTRAGFKLAIPDSWQASRESSGRGYVFEAPDGNQEIRATPVRGQTGASWSFTWQQDKVGQIRSLDLMYITRTVAGGQSFALYMTSPAPAFNRYLATFTEEMRTFRPVP